MTIEDDSAAARLILERLGVSPRDLIEDDEHDKAVVLESLVEAVVDVLPEPSRRLYEPYWRKALKAWPNRLVTDIQPADVAWFVMHCRETAVQRRGSRGGHSAAEHGFDALRCLMRFAAVERIIHPWDDPTEKVAKPKRLATKRRALQCTLLDEIIEVASTTGNDPRLDALLIRLHLETAARRGGALNLTLGDLDQASLLVLLREKGERDRWQPVSRTLMTALLAHADERGVRDDSSPLLRYRTGKPLTRRRYDYIWKRIGEYLDPVHKHNISTHWLRHTTLTWVERTFGYGVARAFAGHATLSSNRFGVTATYIKADLSDVALALSTLTGEPHPLATADAQYLITPAPGNLLPQDDELKLVG